MKLTDLIGYAANDNVRAFLRVIRQGESSQTDDAYRMRFGGELIDPALIWHPGGTVTRLVNGKAIESSAAGAYQFLSRTWENVAHEIGLANFGPASQDLAAIYLIARRGALQDVLAGNLDDAIRKCASEWASLPGSPYGQPTLTIERARAVYEQYGGRYGPAGSAPAPTVDPPSDAPPAVPTQAADPLPPVTETGIDLSTQGRPMLPILGAVLPSLVSAIPELVKILGDKDARVSDRNIAAATKVADVLVRSTGAANEQDAAQKILADPAVAAAARQAVQSAYYELVEVGGGVPAAREFVQAITSTGPDWQRIAGTAFLGALALTIVVGGGFMFWSLLHDASVSGEQKAMLIGAVISLVGSPIAFFFGSSASSRRKDDALASK